MRGRLPISASAAAAIGLMAALIAGCGSGDSSPPPSGRAVFAQECAVCHSLTGRETPQKDGGDLLTVRGTRRELLEFTREMPVHRRLTAAERQAVVSYIIAAQRRAGTR